MRTWRSGLSGRAELTEPALMTADREEMRELFVAYGRTHDRALRDRLAEAHLGLATHLAKRFDHRGEPLEDLIQVASLGLLKAIDRYEPDRGAEFSTFAVPTIAGELKRHFRDRAWTLRVPRRAQELHLEIAAVVGPLTHALQRSPTIDELAERVGVAAEDVVQALEVGNAYRSDSLDAPTLGGAGEGTSLVSTRMGEEDAMLEDLIERSEVSWLLDTLPERERTIIRLRFYGGLTQSEIAERVGISQMQVSRLLTRTLARLRDRGQAARTSQAE
jgi:RNA polymerase sigma-B factor